MKTKIIGINHPLWMEILQQLEHDVYHLPKYVELEAQRTNSISEALVIKEKEQIFFVPYLLRSCQNISDFLTQDRDIFDIVSPYGYPGILLSKAAQQSSDFLNLAFKEFKQALYNRGVCSAFIRLHPILGQNFTDILATEALVANGQTVSIDLTLDESTIWAKTRKGHQSTINKCKRLGLTARRVSFADYFDEFIEIYQETMDRVQAKDIYYFSHEYFKNLLQLKEHLHLGIVEAENQIICASLFFETCGIVQAHLGGTKNNFLKQSPFNLLLHFMSLWAKKRGNKYLHIGGGVGGKKDNLFTFKSGFSKQRHQFLTLRLIINKAHYTDLVTSQAKSLNKSPENLLNSQFFPAYRAS